MFDFNQLGGSDDRVQLVDVGGGYGDVMKQILGTYPQLDPRKCVLQDIEPVIKLADGLRQEGVVTQVTNFHSEQPVKGKIPSSDKLIVADR